MSRPQMLHWHEACALCLGSLLWLCCMADLPEPEEIDGPELLGTRIEVVSAPERARPRGDEPFRVRIFVGRSRRSPRPLEEQLSVQLSLCAGGRLPTGTLYCEDELPLSELDVMPAVITPNELSLTLTLPAEALRLLEGVSDRVTLFGAVCVDGAARRVKGKSVKEDPVTELFSCTDNAGAERPEPLSFTLEIFPDFAGSDIDHNQNPDIACSAKKGACADGVAQDGEPRIEGPIVLSWPAPEGSDEREVKLWPESVDAQPWLRDCATDPRFADFVVHAGDDPYLVRWRADPGDRERFTLEEERRGELVQVPAREELLVSHALTKGGGSLERYFSIIEGDASEAEAEIEVELSPPSRAVQEGTNPIPPGGRIARLFLLVGDGRGGSAFATRALCVVPPEAGK